MATTYIKPKRTTTHPLRTARRNRAAELTANRGKLSPRQQLNRLDKRLGKGVGATKERARLAQLIKAQRTAKVKAAIAAA